MLGPGLVTGAADDDPSGIATYSQAGSQFGFQLAWTLLLTYPLMVRDPGDQRPYRPHHRAGHRRQPAQALSALALQSVVGLLFIANTLNIGADLGAMARIGRAAGAGGARLGLHRWCSAWSARLGQICSSTRATCPS